MDEFDKKVELPVPEGFELPPLDMYIDPDGDLVVGWVWKEGRVRVFCGLDGSVTCIVMSNHSSCTIKLRMAK